ncbi:MAG: 8-oxo-dGTP diphosphatase [Anaerolineae bacterium]|jgi:8-oxo-dGTP diphosphatase
MGRSDQKIIADRYRVFPRTLCFITNGDDVLLLRGASDKRIWPNQYNGVGGHVRSDEDVFTAARREIQEETGLEVRDLRLRGIINIPVDVQGGGVFLFVFTAVALTRHVRASEEGTPEWIPRGGVARLDLVEDLPALLPRVLAMATNDPPFYALYTYDEEDELVITFASASPSRA